MDVTFILIILFFGFLSLAVELFLAPGFTVFGILGGVIITLGIILSFLYLPGNLSITIFLLSILLVTLSLLWFFKYGIQKRFSIQDRESYTGGFKPFAKNYNEFMGKTGITKSPLRPSGTIEIGDELISAVSEGDFIEINTSVLVVKVEGNKLVVRKNS